MSTTPRDAIAGLSERLRNGPLYDADIDGETSLLDKAATAIDALQARVKELEGLTPEVLAKENASLKNWISLHRGDTMSLSNEVDQFREAAQDAESRALRAEQERDEAVAALKPFAKTGKLFLPRSFGDYDQCIYAPAAGPEYNLTGDHLRAARDLVRRLSAGPEKEKKE